MRRRSSPPRSRLLLALVGLLVACSGNRDDSLRSTCGSDGECTSGMKCVAGFCEGESSVVGGGEVQVNAAARAEGVDAVVEVSVDGGGTCKDSACTVKQGATVTFTAPAVTGYRFAGWSGDEKCVGSELVLVLRNVDDDIMCVASYVRRLLVRGDIDGESGVVGAESSAPLAVCSGPQCEVDSGATVILTAPERAGFRFAGWSGDGCAVSSGVQVTVTTDKMDVICTAQYVPGFLIRARADGVEATVLVSSSAATAVCAQSSCQVDAGSPVVISAPQVDGFRFSGFTGAAACISSEPTVSIASADADVECVAQYVRRFRVSGSAQGASPAPTLQASSLDTFASCDGASCVVDQAGSATLFAPTVSGFRLRAWLGVDCAGQTSSSITFEQVDHDIDCIAEYVRGVGVNGTAVGANAAVSASSSSQGAVCAGSSCVLDVGGSVTLTVAPVTGYTFTGWTGDPGCQSAALSFSIDNIDGSKTCVARFSRLRFTVGAALTPAGSGAVASSANTSTAVCAASGCTVDYGSNVTLTATPGTGYDFVRWGGCSTATTPTITLNNVTANASCTATFALRQLTVSTAVSPAGSGSVETPCGAASCQVPYGSAIRLTALEGNAAYRFTGWSGCSTSTERILDLTNVTSARSCTANFVMRTYSVVASVGTGQGSVAPCGAGACIANHGSSITLVAMPAAGFRLQSWTGDCSGGELSFALASITANRSCVANFAQITYPLTANVAPAGAGLITAPCSGASCSVAVSHGAQPVVTAAPNAGYYFAGWSSCSTATTASITLPPVTGARTCTANFALQPRVTALVSPAGVATVTPCFGAACAVNPGSSLTLTPTITNANYRFNGWNCTGVVNQTTGALTLSGISTDLTCTASFIRPRFTVTSAVTPIPRYGSVSTSCQAAACTVNAGESVTLTAVPASASYRFINWTGCVTSTARTITRSNIQADQTCTANFAFNGAPTITATIPARANSIIYDSTRQLYYANVALSGTATDPEDGALTGGSLVWSTSQSAVQTARLGTGSPITVRLYHAGGCALYNHTVTLTATDSRGLSVTYSANVALDPQCIF